MKIREELSPARKRLTSLVSAVAVLALWLLVTAPLLPGSGGISSASDAERMRQLRSAPEETAPPAADKPGGAAGAGDAEPSGIDYAERYDLGGPETAPPLRLPPDGQAPAARDAGQTHPGGAGPSAAAPRRHPLVPATILPSPLAVLRALAYLHFEQALVRSAAWSFYRVTAGFLFAALVAIPLGILMGSYPPVKAAIEPVSGPLRYLPISAVTGIFILLFGTGDAMKVMFLFLGSVVYLLPIVMETVINVEQIYLDTAYTLGAKPRQVLFRVLIPAAWPGIIEACRVIYGVGWTYVILAEVVFPEYGLGRLISISYRRAHIDWAYALLVVVLLLGVGTNEVFRQLQKRLFAWREA